MSFLTVASASKRLGLLRDLAPAATVIGLLVNPTDPAAETATKELEALARSQGLTLHVVRANSEREIDDAFTTLAQRAVGALLVNTEPFFYTRMNQIVALAARHAMADMYPGRDYAVAGGLVGYGASITTAGRLRRKDSQGREAR